MSTGARKARKKSTLAVKLVGPAPAADLPSGTEVLLCKKQVAAAVANISTRRLDEMIANREYPEPDGHKGIRPMWHQSTHNAWVREFMAQNKTKPGGGS